MVLLSVSPLSANSFYLFSLQIPLFLQLISTDQDQQARQKFIKATGGPKTGKWAMQHPDFSNVVRILAGSEHGVGVLGSGISGDVL